MTATKLIFIPSNAHQQDHSQTNGQLNCNLCDTRSLYCCHNAV